MSRKIRYWRPFRLLLIKLSYLCPKWLRKKILDYLYPDECFIRLTAKGIKYVEKELIGGDNELDK